MRLGKLLSVGEVTEAAEVAEVTGQEPAGEPVSAAALSTDGQPEAPATAQLSR